MEDKQALVEKVLDGSLEGARLAKVHYREHKAGGLVVGRSYKAVIESFNDSISAVSGVGHTPFDAVSSAVAELNDKWSDVVRKNRPDTRPDEIE